MNPFFPMASHGVFLHCAKPRARWNGVTSLAPGTASRKFAIEWRRLVRTRTLRPVSPVRWNRGSGRRLKEWLNLIYKNWDP